MNSDRLWAKSWDDRNGEHPRSALLVEHLKDVLAAADRILQATGDDQLAAVGLPVEPYRERFRRIVRLAAALHDLGKANDHFQELIRGERDPRVNPQGIRHEWVTILLLPQLRQWLLPAVQGSELDFSIAEWAVAGHHPALNHKSPPRNAPSGAGVEMCVPVNHQDFQAALNWLRTALGVDLGPVPELPTQMTLPLTEHENGYQLLRVWQRDAQQTWEALKRQSDRLLVPAVKNSLIAADIAGSALPKQAPDDAHLWDWIDVSFDSRPNPDDLQKIVSHRLGNDNPRDFQKNVQKSKDRVTYVKAGCGSGKTLAAYMWAAENHPTRRLYFCYPTTGTATEGFKDYLYSPESEELRELGAKLFHSRRDVDFEIILTTGSDTARPESEAAIRIDALEAWSTPIVACTVDTVLGIVQNNRRGLLSWPALAQSAFVFDEIHAFDDCLFGALLRFLRDLPGLPVLLMTASLPEAREEALREILGKRRAEGFRQQLSPIAGPAELEERPRYHQVTAPNNDPLALVEQTIQQGGKVLWVCNTVKRVMDAADAAIAKGLTPLIYHSRFRYEDRVERHKAVIEAFKGSGAALAICSQVAEMSLDLSADLLVTDLAPVPALIQRLGRLNRRAEEGDATKPFVVIEPGSHLPYTPPELTSAQAWLAKLPAEKISQKHLADLWEQTGDHPPALIASAWLDGGPLTTVMELREGSQGISVLMERDRPVVKACPGELGRFVLPMPPPKTTEWKTWIRERGIPVVPEGFIIYDKLRGAEWQKKK